MGYKRILVPVDGSPTAAKGMKAAITLSRENRGKLLLLHVVEESPAFVTPEAGVDIGPVLESLRVAGRRTLARVARTATKAGAKPEAILAENFGNRVSVTIAREAKRLRADLIVMGTHGRNGLKRALLGSDAELVVRNSTVPVLLVPASGRRRS